MYSAAIRIAAMIRILVDMYNYPIILQFTPTVLLQAAEDESLSLKIILF